MYLNTNILQLIINIWKHWRKILCSQAPLKTLLGSVEPKFCRNTLRDIDTCKKEMSTVWFCRMPALPSQVLTPAEPSTLMDKSTLALAWKLWAAVIWEGSLLCLWQDRKPACTLLSERTSISVSECLVILGLEVCEMMMYNFNNILLFIQFILLVKSRPSWKCLRLNFSLGSFHIRRFWPYGLCMVFFFFCHKPTFLEVNCML